jgi:hypothetical protein
VRVRPFDALAILLSFSLVAAFSLFAYSGATEAPRAVVKGEGGEWILPLDRDVEVAVEGPIGRTEVLVESGEVRIESSPCANQTCVRSGAVSKPGQWVACLPNRVFVRIEGGRKEEPVDAAAF